MELDCRGDIVPLICRLRVANGSCQLKASVLSLRAELTARSHLPQVPERFQRAFEPDWRWPFHAKKIPAHKAPATNPLDRLDVE